jgi:putative peptide zinc metalloprotease protein
MRVVITLLLLGAVVGAVLFIPFPSSVWCLFVLQPHDATSVYVVVEGVLEDVQVKTGDQVEPGTLLAQLSNPDLEIVLAELAGQRDSYQAQLGSLQKIRFRDEQVGSQITVIREQLKSVEEQLLQKREDFKRLGLVASVAGTVIAPPQVRAPGTDEQIDLPAWVGTPLDPENLGATLLPEGAGSLFCQIGDPNQWEAVLVIDQNDINLVQDGQEVRMMFDESPYHVYISQIASKASDAMQSVPPQLASTSGGPLPAQADPDGVVRPLSTSYQAVVRLDNQTGLLRNGLIGQARVKTVPRTLASRLYRYLSRTFNFEL